ncbi:MAG: hypothetical protein ACYCS7_13335 [Acidimicrobiales bacterium]
MALASVWGQVERMQPPRALYAEFPLGRPLGRPNDPAFQRRVLDAAFGLLDRRPGPVLERFGEAIEDGADEVLACSVPPRLDPSGPPAVDEARGLRPAYERAVAANGGRTLVGRVMNPDAVPDALAGLVRIAGGVPARQAGLPADPVQTVMDIRAYYEEAATALAGHVPAARSAETWFYHHTEAGKAVMDARAALKEAGVPYPVWFYLAPATQ